jgi:hypothetical protein
MKNIKMKNKVPFSKNIKYTKQYRKGTSLSLLRACIAMERHKISVLFFFGISIQCKFKLN